MLHLRLSSAGRPPQDVAPSTCPPPWGSSCSPCFLRPSAGVWFLRALGQARHMPASPAAAAPTELPSNHSLLLGLRCRWEAPLLTCPGLLLGIAPPSPRRAGHGQGDGSVWGFQPTGREDSYALIKVHSQAQGYGVTAPTGVLTRSPGPELAWFHTESRASDRGACRMSAECHQKGSRNLVSCGCFWSSTAPRAGIPGSHPVPRDARPPPQDSTRPAPALRSGSASCVPVSPGQRRTV